MTCVSNAAIISLFVCLFVFLLIYSVGRLAPINSVCVIILHQMRSEMKKNIFHLAWSPDSLPANEAAAPLLDCLDHILLDLQPNLLPDAFHRCVAAIWDVLLVELWAQAEVSSGVSTISFPLRFFCFSFLAFLLFPRLLLVVMV
jgi:hypothetical protein